VKAPALLTLGFLFLLGVLPSAAGSEPALSQVSADPPVLHLRGPQAGYTILVQGRASDGQVVDLTSTAEFRSLNPKIASVNAAGFVRALADGSTAIIVEAASRTLTIPVTVQDAGLPRRLGFEKDVLPLLSKFGCNSSGCHGKAEGQNGFKLSVFGFDPAADYAALTKESRGRRVFPAAPDHSLLLSKASGSVAHGGGVRIRRGTSEYETLRAWVAAGVPFGSPTDPTVVSLRIEPHERRLAMHGRQQLRVLAHYSDGQETDVTAHAKYQSNNEGLASVSATGLVTAGEAPGDVAIMAGYRNAVEVFRALIPRHEPIAYYPALPENNFIDQLVYRKLRKLNLLPSEQADEATYLRRVYLDVIGTLPTADEARRYLRDPRPDRRARLVDELLKRSEFADYWAMKWADLLRVDRQALGHKYAYGYYRWIRDSVAANKPLDQFARELLTAEGPLGEVGPASFYKVVGKPGEAASTLSQIFLSVRLACAECHHHPFDRWSQSDYYGMQAFFTPLAVRPGVTRSGDRATTEGEMLQASGDPSTLHPRTGESIYAHALGMKMPDHSTPGDRRAILARWLTLRDNPWFARSLANRTWAHFLGRGLVEPVDDVRATNPPTNPELLDALAAYLIEHGYDFRQFVRLITSSRVYQLSSQPNATNARDEQNYSRAFFKRIEAEVLLDMVCQTTGIGEKFPGVPAGSRAIQLWDSKVPHYFLKLFGRPVRVSACSCERNHEPSVSQVLHLLNAPEIHAKMAHEGGLVARLVRQHAQDEPLVQELYLTFFSRLPSEKERTNACAYLRADPGQRRQATEDLAWSMLNSLEFIFNH
jgi:hypothetical protein